MGRRGGDGNTQQDSEERESERSMPLPDRSDSAQKSAGTQPLAEDSRRARPPPSLAKKAKLKEPREPKKRDREPDVNQPAQHHLIRWTLPLEEFHVEPRSRYVAKEPLLSPVMTTLLRATGGSLSLDWQLCLRQTRTEAKLELLHKTPDIPNQGVHYTVWASSRPRAGAGSG